MRRVRHYGHLQPLGHRPLLSALQKRYQLFRATGPLRFQAPHLGDRDHGHRRQVRYRGSLVGLAGSRQVIGGGAPLVVPLLMLVVLHQVLVVVLQKQQLLQLLLLFLLMLLHFLYLYLVLPHQQRLLKMLQHGFIRKHHKFVQ